MGRKNRNKYYVVVEGREPGIYTEWDGPEGAAAQVDGVSGALYRGFKNALEARWWLEDNEEPELLKELRKLIRPARARRQGVDQRTQALIDAGKVVIYTDGGAIRNPGPGGYGAVLRFGDYKKELSGGFRRTTNNRMELMGCIRSLQALKRTCDVVLHSDSRYVVNGIEKGWAARWRAYGWKRNKEEMAKNVDLWAPLLQLVERQDVEFRWVKGHAGNPDNERCDHLATRAAKTGRLQRDVAYEMGRTQIPPGT
jgi:ribonuclease HI